MKQNRRRQFLAKLGLGITAVSTIFAKDASAHHTDTHFNDKSAHHLNYQLNKADHDYIDHILFSCGEMLRKYGDDIEIVVTALGPGLNLLALHPKRPITSMQKKRVKSLMEYGVKFQACGNTMKSMNWEKKDLLAEAELIPVGIDGIMQLQEQGFSYISW